jgi:hypothetical protein
MDQINITPCYRADKEQIPADTWDVLRKLKGTPKSKKP